MHGEERRLGHVERERRDGRELAPRDERLYVEHLDEARREVLLERPRLLEARAHRAPRHPGDEERAHDREGRDAARDPVAVREVEERARERDERGAREPAEERSEEREGRDARELERGGPVSLREERLRGGALLVAHGAELRAHAHGSLTRSPSWAVSRPFARGSGESSSGSPSGTRESVR